MSSTSQETDNLTSIPLRGIRGMIADKMQKSLQESAQLTHHASCDMSALQAKKQALTEIGEKVSVEDLIIYALVKTLQTHPYMNGVLKDRTIELSKAIHLSIAIALDNNLLVAPALFDTQDKTVQQLRAGRKDLAERAKSNKLTVTEMTGGTFTISNLGLSRVQYFTPILNTPQMAILGIGQITQTAQPAADGSVLWKPMMGLSLTFDHRAIDGAPAAQFLSDLCNTIETFDSLM